MRYILDSCILRELLKPDPAQALLNWLVLRADGELYISAISLSQLYLGAAKLNELRRSREIKVWLDKIETDFGNRVLPFTGVTAQFWAMLTQQNQDKSLPLSDSYVLASAVEHGAVVVTRQTSALAQSGAQIFDPWNPRKLAGDSP